MIVDYLRENMGIKTIGCHGESIGGLVATHIARWKNLDFLCADRTFESLISVGKALAGRGIGLLFRLVTGWDDRLVQDFLESKCYKMITFDPYDEVIPYLSSLQYGITSRVVQTKLGITKGEPKRPVDKGPYRIYSPLGWIMRIKKIVYGIQNELFTGKVNRNLKDEYGPSLPKEQVEVLYQALTRLYKIFDIYKKIRYDSFFSQPIQMVNVSEPAGILEPSSQDNEKQAVLDAEKNNSKSITKGRYDNLYDQDAHKDLSLFWFLTHVNYFL